jgi:hypothetical protein
MAISFFFRGTSRIKIPWKWNWQMSTQNWTIMIHYRSESSWFSPDPSVHDSLQIRVLINPDKSESSWFITNPSPQGAGWETSAAQANEGFWFWWTDLEPDLKCHGAPLEGRGRANVESRGGLMQAFDSSSVQWLDCVLSFSRFFLIFRPSFCLSINFILQAWLNTEDPVV